ncbi:MAG: NADH-quinone oxidoreductase subunit NuoH [Gemmatimonadales bacterium]|nr:NADH-quinone oxidoreductase subunit NuoH [Gemmatimonadota bacterium]MCL4213454.1 NADH-quinone oxidoreductase subunit NuoH [Gemmatimonadales bacterium]
MQLPPSTWVFLIATVVKMLIVFTVYMVGVAYTTLAERKISAWIQDRHGPNRVGPWGLFQVLADGVKNIMKEETMPGEINKPIFILAPALAFVPALLAWAVIPFGAPLPTPWGRIDLVVADLPIGFLFTLAITSLGVYGIVLAGWASNNKYALLGGLRASAQMVSYEIAMGMSTVCVLLIAGNVSLNTIIVQQATMGWNVLVLSIAAFLFLVAAFAETNRVPFDLPEAESELIAGYHSEYSAMKFSMFPISEYANMLTASAMFVTLFFGGWDIPFTQWDNSGPATVLKALATVGMFSFKVGFFVFFYIWVRWTLPRFRYDQLMSLGWKFMLPVALAYIVIAAAAILGLDYAGLERGRTFGLAMFGINLVLLVVLFVILDRGRIISPASSRIERERLGRLRARAVQRAHLAPGEIR